MNLRKNSISKEYSLPSKLHTESVTHCIRTDSAITLIALVITIIVLLILVGVSLSLIGGSDGILGRSEKAVDATNISSGKEQAELLVADYLSEYYEEAYINANQEVARKTVEAYIQGKITEGGMATSAGDYFVTIGSDKAITVYRGTSADESEKIAEGTLSTGGKVSWADEATSGGADEEPEEETPTIPEGLAVGSTVSYTPSGTYTEWTAAHSGYSTSYSLASGSSYTDSSTQTDMTISSWKVFKINETTGEVQLVPSSPTSNSLYLKGANGYNNAVKLLNDACSSLYGNTSKGITAESIDIEDIESVLDYDPTTYSGSYATYGQQYRSAYTSKKQYPIIYASEEKNVIDGTENEGTLGLSDSASDWVSGSVTAGTSIQPYQTYYYLSNSDFSSKLNEGYSGMLLPSGSSTQYWVASRCVDLNSSSYCDFDVRRVGSGCLSAGYVFDSNGLTEYYDRSLFPVVSLAASLIAGDATAGWSVE